MSARDIMADALVGALMLHIRRAATAEEIAAIVNDAIDSGWILPHRLPLLDEGIFA